MNDLRFSVVITTFDRPAQLVRCLASLARCEYPRDKFEVIVVDDGGTAPLGEILGGFRTELNVTLIKQCNGGPAKGRNRDASATRNEFLAFIDDDCEATAGWLSALERQLKRSSECLVGGRCVNGWKENPYSAASQIIVDMVYAYYNADGNTLDSFRRAISRCAATCFGAAAASTRISGYPRTASSAIAGSISNSTWSMRRTRWSNIVICLCFRPFGDSTSTTDVVQGIFGGSAPLGVPAGFATTSNSTSGCSDGGAPPLKTTIAGIWLESLLCWRSGR